MSHQTNRRDFLKTTALGAAGFCILRNPQSARSAQANSRLNIALIGTGGRGAGFVGKTVRSGHNLVAVCDVDLYRMEELANLPAGIRKFQDFRKLLDEMDRQIDAVVIATTDHNHAIITSAAMNRGKHVFCEKPLTHSIEEARFIRRLANEKKNLITQMGNQGVSSDIFRRVLEQVQQGVIGEVREVHAWFDGLGGEGTVDLGKEPIEIPEDLNWDLFLGPAAMRPYHPYLTRGNNWRDFMTGTMGVCFVHSIHMAFRALDLGALWNGGGAPGAVIRVEARFPEHSKQNYPQWQIVQYDIPARGKLPPVKVNCYNGREASLEERGVIEQMEKIAGRSLDWTSGWAPTSGSLLVGSKGAVHTNPHNSRCAILPESHFPDQGGPPRTIPMSGPNPTRTDGEADQQIFREWIAACTGGKPTYSDFDRAAPATEFTLLGNIATLVGRPIEFDPVAGRITNDRDADQALRPPRRKGWEL